MLTKGGKKDSEAQKKAEAQAKDMREAIEETMNGQYYRAHDGQSLPESLAEDVDELLQEHTSTVARGICAAQDIVDASSTGELQQTAMQAAGEVREAVDVARRGAGLALESPGHAVGVAKETAEAFLEVLEDGVLEAGADMLSEAVSDAVPVVGMVRGLWRIGCGMGNVTRGALSLTVSASAVAIGGAAGAAISPLDGGRLLESSMDTAREYGAYGGCLTGEGLCKTLHGTASVVGQVSGTQVVTIPLGIAAGCGARACRNLRTGDER